MDKPDIQTFDIGDIFQINPIGDDMINIRYGGDFLISTEIHDWGVLGYLAQIYIDENLSRYRGLAFVRIPWGKLERIGKVEWFMLVKEPTSSSES